jgi:hypothetical protein
MRAVESASLHVVEFLLQNGAKIQQETIQGMIVINYKI